MLSKWKAIDRLGKIYQGIYLVKDLPSIYRLKIPQWKSEKKQGQWKKSNQVMIFKNI